MTYAPISEAPRDGSPVLATWSPGVCCCTAIWDGVQWCEADTEHEFMPQPTHYLVGWSPLGAEDAPDDNTVRARVAVVVSINGKWNACGGSWARKDRDAMSAAIEGSFEDGEARYWITADLPIPAPVEAAATVEIAE